MNDRQEVPTNSRLDDAARAGWLYYVAGNTQDWAKQQWLMPLDNLGADYAASAGLYPDLASACAAMRQADRERRPNPAAKASFDRDYRIFLEMHRQRQALDDIA